MTRRGIVDLHLAEALKRPDIGAALARLRDAHEQARAMNRPEEDFAVELTSLLHNGSTASALRWLIYSDNARLLDDLSTTARRRIIHPAADLRFSENRCLLLSAGGLELADAVEANRQAPAHNGVAHRAVDDLKPVWIRRAWQLFFDGQLVKEFRKFAKWQFLILDAFQEDGWAYCIDDPLPGTSPAARRKRLRNAIVRLNEEMAPPRLEFHGNGEGDGVCWKEVVTRSQKTPPIGFLT